MNTPELLERLRRHYLKPGDFPGGVFVPECGWNGGAGSRRCDALYVGFTSTSGRKLVGHELKVSRADWLHELAQLGKADAWHDQCHAWNVVAPGEDVVPREELPEGWGLMVPGGSKTRMKVVVRPAYHERTPSWDAVRSIMSRLDTLQVQALHAARAKVEEREREVAAREQLLDGTAERSLPQEEQSLLDAARLLRDQHGIDLRRWSLGDQGIRPEVFKAAVRLARAADRMTLDRTDYVHNQLRQRAQNMLDSLGEFEAATDALRSMAGKA